MSIPYLGGLNRVSLALTDVWGRPVVTEILVRRDTVDIRCDDTVVGIADREVFRNWLNFPLGVYAFDDTMFCPAGFGVALAIDNRVPYRALDDYALEELRAYV